MKAVIAAAGFFRLSSICFAQGQYTICDTTEVCICHDGTEANHTFTFYPCQPGEVITMITCCGEIPENFTGSVFNGMTTASPLVYVFGPTSVWPGQQLVSFDSSGGLTFRVNYAPTSVLSCANGDYAPLVIGLFSALPEPPPPPPIPPVVCPLPAACCLTAATEEVSGPSDLVFYCRDGALQCSSGSFTGSLELRDVSGRLIEQQRVHGEHFVPLSASLATGTYVVTLLGEGKRASQSIVVP